MSITYSSGVITVTGGTETSPNTFADIKTANDNGGWGVVTQQDRQFNIAAAIVIGDGSTTTWFIDTNLLIEITKAQSTYKNFNKGAFIYVRSGANFRLGKVLDSTDKTTGSGCTVITKPTGNGYEAISGTGSAVIELFGSKIIHYNYYGYIWFTAAVTGGSIKIWNSLIDVDYIEAQPSTSGYKAGDV